MPDGTATPESTLPNDLAICHGMIRELVAALREQRHDNEQLSHRLDQLLKRLYGPRADRVNPDQLSLFDEPAEPPPPPSPTPVIVTTTTPKPGHGRRKLPDNLRRETVVVDISDAEKQAVGGT